jgi:hypothetical protein
MAHKFPAKKKTNVEINQTSKKMEYKKSSYFNTEDTYVFESSLNDVFESKVEFYNGNYYTINPKFCSYKDSLRCIKSIMNTKPIINRLVRTYSNSTGIIVSNAIKNKKIMMGRPDYFYKVQIVESGDSGFNRGDIVNFTRRELIIKNRKDEIKR